jgi:leucyl aminopeptidase
MTPIRAAEYFRAAVAGLAGVEVEEESDFDRILADYPCLGAVSRADRLYPHHHPRVVKVVYEHPEDRAAGAAGGVRRQVVLVGKGVTFDTGGADVKVGGAMIGMKRDCGGAAAAAGFVVTAAHAARRGTRVVAYLGWVRNSVGAGAFTCDEVIVSRGGRRVLVINTDAEGRMVMTDLLARARVDILADQDAGRAPEDVRVHTMATLTGHAVIAFGVYTALVPNGPAAAAGDDAALFDAAAVIGDPAERSTIRREDYAFVAPQGPHYDVLQCNAAPSSRTPRGHQFPAAFLIKSSGLDEHGIDSARPLRYTHLDIAASASIGSIMEGRETGAPVPALAQAYLFREE